MGQTRRRKALLALTAAALTSAAVGVAAASDASASSAKAAGKYQLRSSLGQLGLGST